MTAIANDISYDDIFVLQLKEILKKDDLIIAISGSGNSKNIIKAVEYAKEIGAEVVGLTGYSGGKLKELADYSMHVPVDDMQITEDIHISEYLPNVMYYTYIDSYEAQVNYSGIVLQGILYLLIFLSLYIIVKNSKDCEEDCNFYLNCIYLSVLFLVLSSQATVLERFKFYFDIYLIVAVPMVFSKIKNLITKSIAYLVVFTIGFAYWYIIALYRPYWTETIDYRFFF